MKKIIRIIAVLLIAATLLCGCGKKAKYAIKVGDQIVSEGTFARQAKTVAGYLAESEQEFESEESFEEAVSDYLIDLKLFAQKFDDLALSFTAEEEQEIDDYLSEVIATWDSITEFQQALADAGYTYEEYLEELTDFKKKAKVLNYYFGPEGQEPVSIEDLKAYYANHHALIKYVAVSTVDEETGALYEGEDLKEAKKKAEDAYAEATRVADEDHFAEVIDIYSEDTSTKDTPMVLSDEAVEEDTLTAKVMKMEVGQVILMEVEGSGYMVIKRYDATTDAHFATEVRESALEDYRAKEIEELLEGWREEIPAKINHKVTKKYCKIEK